MKFSFWKKSKHYDLGYKPDYTGTFENSGEASKFCDANGYECFDDAV